jgi:hypothetical protein
LRSPQSPDEILTIRNTLNLTGPDPFTGPVVLPEKLVTPHVLEAETVCQLNDGRYAYTLIE